MTMSQSALTRTLRAYITIPKRTVIFHACVQQESISSIIYCMLSPWPVWYPLSSATINQFNYVGMSRS